MFWVGLLYIKQSNVYINGRKVAGSLAHAINYLAMHPTTLPKWWVVFVPKEAGSNPWITRIVHHANVSGTCMVYRQQRPYIYIQSQPLHYLVSIIIGFLLAGIGLVYQWQGMADAIEYAQKPKPPFIVAATNTKKLLQSVCKKPDPCIQSMTLFPQTYAIRFKTEPVVAHFLALSGARCQRFGEKGVLCSKK